MVATVFLLLSAAAVCFGNGTDSRLKNDPQCQREGQQCSSDLSQIIYCSGANGNSYTVRNCRAENKVCSKTDTDEYTCSKKISDPSMQEPKMTPFLCHGSAIFPDPFFCNIAYACSSEGEYPDQICECSNGTALVLYPSMKCTSDLDTMEDCSCPYKDRCDGKFNPGDFGIGCNPGYFYTCKLDPKLGIIPDVYKCPDGQVFIEGKCSTGLDFSKISVANVVVKPSCKKYEPPCLPEDKIKCTVKGQLISHKVSRCYYFCDNNLKPILRDCGNGSYFTCRHGPCGCTYKPKD